MSDTLLYIINGKKLAAEREAILKKKVAKFVSEFHRKPKLVAVEISEDPGSVLYLKLKRAAAERIGIEFEVKRTVLPALEGLSFMRTDGIFIQHPPRYDKQKWQEFVDQIPPEKDVDCLTSENLRLIQEGKPRFLPATVKAIGYCLLWALPRAFSRVGQQPLTGGSRLFSSGLSEASSYHQSEAPNTLFDDASIPSKKTRQLLEVLLVGKRVVILGRSPMVGLPLSWWLGSLGVRVDVLHSQTESSDQKAVIRKADILISATGKPGMITGDMVKQGATVIDVGSPRGDIDFASVSKKASAITPVPGGVGPLTVMSLMENVVQSAVFSSEATTAE